MKIYDAKHLSSKNIKKISYEIKVLDALKDSGLEIALPVKNREGHYITAHGKEKAVIFTFAPGKYVAEPNGEQVQMAGRLLARFHSEAKKYTTKRAKNYSNKETVMYWLKAWQEYQQQNVVGTDVPIHSIKYQKILQDLQTYQSHCHGDLSLINYLFEKERCYLIDFQSIGYGPVLLDLANGMVEFAARKNDFLFDNLEEFQKGYESYRQLSKAEKASLADTLVIQMLARQARLIRLHYGGYGYELKTERLLGLKIGLSHLVG